MTTKLSGRVSREFSIKTGFQTPQTSRTGRAILPSFTDAVPTPTMSIIGTEFVTVTIATPVLGSAATATVSATQYLKDLVTFPVASSDIAKMIVTNTSVIPPANIFAGAPTIVLVSAQGNPIGGEFQSGRSYTNIGLRVTVPLYATASAAAGSLSVSANILLLGTATGNALA